MEGRLRIISCHQKKKCPFVPQVRPTLSPRRKMCVVRAFPMSWNLKSLLLLFANRICALPLSIRLLRRGGGRSPAKTSCQIGSDRATCIEAARHWTQRAAKDRLRSLQSSALVTMWSPATQRRRWRNYALARDFTPFPVRYQQLSQNRN